LRLRENSRAAVQLSGTKCMSFRCFFRCFDVPWLSVSASIPVGAGGGQFGRSRCALVAFSIGDVRLHPFCEPKQCRNVDYRITLGFRQPNLRGGILCMTCANPRPALYSSFPEK
jgi:hypothetical protein